jgi:hypothetical protein
MLNCLPREGSIFLVDLQEDLEVVILAMKTLEPVMLLDMFHYPGG